MIEMTRNTFQDREWSVKVVGVGGAGTHALARLAADGFAGGDLIAAHTDSRALNLCHVPTRLALGQRMTRGLGVGGDPELGRAAVEESQEVLRDHLGTASLVLLITGLGGGTGSGGAPRVAEMAREMGAQVVVLATLPFSFEGRRRAEQAAQGLEALRKAADLVICFENDRMSSLVDSSAGVEEAFGVVDSLLAQTVASLVSMTHRRSVMHSGFDDIAAAISAGGASAFCGFGRAEGESRVRLALETALQSPLLGGYDALQRVSGLWISISGGSDLRWSEVQSLMEELSQRLPESVRLFFGAVVDPLLAGAATVTLLAGANSGTLEQVQTHPISLPKAISAALPDASTRWNSEENLEASREREPETQGMDPEAEHAELGEEAESVEELEPVEEPEPIVEPEPFTPLAESPSSPEPVPPARGGSGPRPRNSPDLRRDIGASFLKRRLLARNAEATARAEEAQLAQNPSRVALPSRGQESSVSDEPETQELPQKARVSSETEPLVNNPTPGVGEQGGVSAAAGSQAAKSKSTVQEQMRFEPVSRGRFEKTDPTVVDGQDLDIPTFLRRRISLGHDASSASVGH